MLFLSRWYYAVPYALHTNVRDRVRTLIEDFVTTLPRSFGVSGEIHWHPGYPVTTNHAAEAEQVRMVAARRVKSRGIFRSDLPRHRKTLPACWQPAPAPVSGSGPMVRCPPPRCTTRIMTLMMHCCRLVLPSGNSPQVLAGPPQRGNYIPACCSRFSACVRLAASPLATKQHTSCRRSACGTARAPVSTCVIQSAVACAFLLSGRSTLISG